MKIIIIGPFAIRPKGTVSVRALQMAKALKNRINDIDIDIVLPPYDNLDESNKDYDIDGIKICNIKIPKNVSTIEHFLIAYRLVRKTMSLTPGVVYVFKPKGYSGLAAMILIFLRWINVLKIKIILDSDDWEGYGGFNDFYKCRNLYPKPMLDFFDFQEKWIPKRCDIITVASRTLETQMWGFGIHKNKVVYIPNGPYKDWLLSVNDKELVRRKYEINDAYIILLYTRFFEYDLNKVINIVKSIKCQMDDFKLLVVGKGDFGEEIKLQELSKREGLSDFFIFVGWIEPEELPNYLICADIAIYPFDDNLLNRSKCSGKLMELMSMKMPVVAERVGQIGEYIENEKSGILVDPDDINSFVENIIRLLKDKDLRLRIGENARERIWNVFGWNKSIVKIEKCINNILM